MEALFDFLSLDFLAQAVMKLGWGFFSFFNPKELYSYVNLAALTVVVVLLYLWAKRKGEARSLREFAFPRDVWRHPSARLDLRFFFVIQAFWALALSPAAAALAGVTSGMDAALTEAFGPTPMPLPSPWGGIAYTLLVFLGVDFGLFYSHYLSHKYPLLWCFHKVHHSAEVLVPFTAVRFHPLDMLWNMAFGALLAGTLGGLGQYVFYPEAKPLTLFGNNMIVALSYLTTHNLRHMHLWMHYPKWLNRWLISPAQHQIHHSRERRHWDKNMGYLLPCWDRWFGTLYVPEGREEFRLGVTGVPESGPRAHTSIRALLIVPFLDAADWWQKRKDRRKPSL